MGKKRGKNTRKAKQQANVQENEELVQAPHSFVIYRGRLGRNTGELMRNFKKVLEPYTASQLKIQKRNVIKDFVSVSGMLHVSHLVVFTKSKQAVYMRLGRLPRGPTLTFCVREYCLSRDVLSSLKKRVTYASQFAHHPLLVLNNFSGEGMHLKLMTSMFQNMFPSINVNKVKLNTIRRCVLLNYDEESKTVEFRHYTIKVVPCGISKTIKKIVQSKIPDLSKYDDISEFILQPGYMSESEAEQDTPFNQVTLPQQVSSRGNQVFQKSSIRLVELGPRMKLELIKIQEGIMDGEVLYHSRIKKTPQEIKQLKMKKEKQRKLKLHRKKKQENDVQKKAALKKSLDAQQRPNENENDERQDNNDDEDDKWYEEEVGKKPSKDLFTSLKRKPTTNIKTKKSVKRVKFN